MLVLVLWWNHTGLQLQLPQWQNFGMWAVCKAVHGSVHTLLKPLMFSLVCELCLQVSFGGFYSGCSFDTEDGSNDTRPFLQFCKYLHISNKLSGTFSSTRQRIVSNQSVNDASSWTAVDEKYMAPFSYVQCSSNRPVEIRLSGISPHQTDVQWAEKVQDNVLKIASVKEPLILALQSGWYVYKHKVLSPGQVLCKLKAWQPVQTTKQMSAHWFIFWNVYTLSTPMYVFHEVFSTNAWESQFREIVDGWFYSGCKSGTATLDFHYHRNAKWNRYFLFISPPFQISRFNLFGLEFLQVKKKQTRFQQ